MRWFCRARRRTRAEQFVVLLHQGLQQRLVIRPAATGSGWRSRRRPAGGTPGRTARAALLATVARACWMAAALRLDQADGLKNLRRRRGRSGMLLLAVQQGEHFAVILQFLAQGVDQGVGGFHGSLAFFLAWGRKRGLLRRGVGQNLVAQLALQAPGQPKGAGAADAVGQLIVDHVGINAGGRWTPPSADGQTGLRMSCKIWRSSTASNWRDTSATFSLSDIFGLPASDSSGSWEALMWGWSGGDVHVSAG